MKQGLPGLYHRQTGSLVQSPDSIFSFYGSQRQVGGREIFSLVREAAAQAIVEPAGGKRTLDLGICS